MSPSPRYIHQRIIVNLVRLLAIPVEELGLGEILVAPFDVLLSENDIVQPDVLFISRENRDILNEKNVQGAPDITIEVLSPGSSGYDQQVKFHRYEHFGVREYWIINPDQEEIHVYRLADGRYQEAAVLKNEENVVVDSPLLPGLTISLSDVFQRP